MFKIRPRVTNRLFFAAAFLLPAFAYAQDRRVTIVATTDVESWESLLEAPPANLGVCLGGGLFSSWEGKKSKGRFSIDAFSRARLDAIGLSPQELASGDELRGCLAESKVPFLSASYGGAKEWLVKDCSGIRVGLATLDGDPARMKNRIAAARKDSDILVLVSHFSKNKVVPLLKEVRGIQVCLVRQGEFFDPRPLKVGDTWFVDVPSGGRALAKIVLEIKGKGVVGVRSDVVRPQPDSKAWDRLLQLRAKHGLRPESAGLADKLEIVKTPMGTGPKVLERLVPGEVQAFRGEGSNRAAQVILDTVSLRDGYGPLRPSPGNRLLLLHAKWTNVMPLTEVYKRKLPTEYRIPDLREALYLIVNGDHAARLHPQGISLAGVIPAKALKLKEFGYSVTGNLLFEVPAEGIRSLELRLYDFGHGHIRIPLFRAKEGPPEEKPVAIAKNDVMEAGVFRLRREKEWRGRKAPPNGTFLVFDFRARSLVEFEVDATAFLPKAKPGEKSKSGTMFDFQDFPTSLHLIVDGKYTFLPLEAEAAPRFLPDLLTGQELAYLVPEKTSSTELIVELANLRLPNGEVVHPKSLRMSLEGKRPAEAAGKAIATHDDAHLTLSIVKQEISGKYAGMSAGEGKEFLIVDVEVRNKDKQARPYDAERRLQYYTKAGTYVNLSPATFRSPYAPARPVSIPPGETRAFRVAYEIPKREQVLRLSSAGAKGKVLALNARAEEPKRTCPKCSGAVAPDDKFCQGCGAKVGP